MQNHPSPNYPAAKMNNKADLLIGALCWLMTLGLIAGIVAGALR
jgi:hypothetical protein